MSTKNTFEKMARNTWLAGLGSIENSIELLSKSIDAAQEKSNSLYNEFLTRGEEIQSKMFEARDDLEARGKKLFGMNAEDSHDEQLANLNAKVDHLTAIVNKLLEEAEAATPEVKKTASPAKKATIVPKLDPKEVKAQPRATRRTAAKTTKTVKKPAAKTKTTAKAKPARTVKKTTAKATEESGSTE